jgi:hypothetical protein
MTVRLATAADRPEIRTLFVSSGLTVFAPLLPTTDFTRTGSRVVVNVDEVSGAILAFALGYRDDTAVEKAIVFQWVGGTLLRIRELLKDVAQWGITNGYTRWYSFIPQRIPFPQFATMLDYLEARWSYAPNSLPGGRLRCMTGDLTEVLAAA